MPDRAPARVCAQCRFPLVPSSTRGLRESVAFLLGANIRRCLSCEARFVCVGQFIIPSRPKRADEASLAIVWIAISGGVAACLGIALWTLRKFHRWPF